LSANALQIVVSYITKQISGSSIRFPEALRMPTRLPKPSQFFLGERRYFPEQCINYHRITFTIDHDISVVEITYSPRLSVYMRNDDPLPQTTANWDDSPHRVFCLLPVELKIFHWIGEWLFSDQIVIAVC